MDDDSIIITPEDAFAVREDPDGYPALKIENTVFVDAPRWLLFTADERNASIDALIDALTALRDAPPTAP